MNILTEMDLTLTLVHTWNHAVSLGSIDWMSSRLSGSPAAADKKHITESC